MSICHPPSRPQPRQHPQTTPGRCSRRLRAEARSHARAGPRQLVLDRVKGFGPQVKASKLRLGGVCCGYDIRFGSATDVGKPGLPHRVDLRAHQLDQPRSPREAEEDLGARMPALCKAKCRSSASESTDSVGFRVQCFGLGLVALSFKVQGLRSRRIRLGLA